MINAFKSFRSANFFDLYISHEDFRGIIAKPHSNVEKENATFKIVEGLIPILYHGSNSISFESMNFPGHYLRVRTNGEIFLDKLEDTHEFREQTTFMLYEEDTPKGKVVTIKAFFSGGKYIFHDNFKLYIGDREGKNDGDYSFLMVDPPELENTSGYEANIEAS